MMGSKYIHSNETYYKKCSCKKGDVGIITNYANTNYGSVLQSYALQTVLKELGFHGENIRWERTNHRKGSLFYLTASWLYHALSYLMDPVFRRNSRFRNFVQGYIKESKDAYNTLNGLESLNDIYDAFICGSDQIWAPNQFHERYYLSFVHNDKNKIAYAPSIGLPSIPDDLVFKISELLVKIKHLSIREAEGASIIKKMTGQEAKIVLDPTMLIDRDQWLKVATGKVPKDGYILCYFLGDNAMHRQAVEFLKKKTSYKIVVLPFQFQDYGWGDLQIADAGPSQFLRLVDCANLILTDSFHGMVFSILFNKQFFAFMRFTGDDPLCQNSRVEHLLSRYRLKKQIVTSESIASQNCTSIDYEIINKKIAEDRKTSVQYLENALVESVS